MGEGDEGETEPLMLLPTPAVNDMGANKTVEQWDEWTARMQAKHGNGNGHGKSLSLDAQRLLPTPRATDGSKGGPNQRGSKGDLMLPSAAVQLLPTPRAQHGEDRNQRIYLRPLEQPQNLENALARTTHELHDFGPYTAAVRRWEAVVDRPAPMATEVDHNGRPRLSPRFVEWMMGLPHGWVTGLGLKRNPQLKMLGNGVVPQQAAQAIRMLLGG